MGLPNPNGLTIRLYMDGKVQVIGIGTNFRTMENINGKVIKELRISPEQVQAYAEKLVENGFFSYEPPFSMVFDGLVETLKLNYKGKKREINGGNQTERVLFPKIIGELEKLIGSFF